jgi:chorismate-pyruvate lyase
MIQLQKYPLTLQLLMQTDGTVTELIKLLTRESIQVVKLDETIDQETNILTRRIFLQGKETEVNWLYASSKIYLKNLPVEFCKDLLENNLPIGSLWIKYRMETFKQLVDQYEDPESNSTKSGLNQGKYLTRIYQVFNQKKQIMEITEKFPINEYSLLESEKLNS